jgi:septal ring factor EnvC (AmiA/AmiB activator)
LQNELMQIVLPVRLILQWLMLVVLGGCLLGLTAASAQAPRPQAPAVTPSPDALKTRDQELEAVRAEQRRTLENEARLKREIESIGDDRRKFNQQLIETASRVVAVEERIAQTQARLEPLDDREQALRTSLEQRRSVTAEVLAALQRIGRHAPSALVIRAEDALQAVRSAMMLGAVLPEMRQQAEVLAADLTELVRLRQQIAAERDRLARDLFVLASAFRCSSTSARNVWRRRNKRLPTNANAPPSWRVKRKTSISSSPSSNTASTPLPALRERRAQARTQRHRVAGPTSPPSRIPAG